MQGCCLLNASEWEEGGVPTAHQYAKTKQLLNINYIYISPTVKHKAHLHLSSWITHTCWGTKSCSMRWHNSGSIAHWRIFLPHFYFQFSQISVWLLILSLGSSLFSACRNITPSLPGFGLLSPLGQYPMWLSQPLAASQLLTSCLFSPIIY